MKKGDVVWWESPQDDGIKSCMVQVMEVREKGLLHVNENFVSVKQLYDDVVIEVNEEELQDADLLFPEPDPS